MAKNDSEKNGGVSFDSLLQIAFIVLKLCGTINWSWWWVLSPTWISILIAIAEIWITVKWR